MIDSLEEITFTLEQVQQLFRDLIIGGLLIAGEDKIYTLRALHKEFSRIGAMHIAEHLQQLLLAIENNNPESAVLLMRAQASVQLFQRILNLQYATDALHNGYDSISAPEVEKNSTKMQLPCPEPTLSNLLDNLCHSVEGILLTGMTTANKATCDSLQMAFQTASQMNLLRLGSTLRVAVEEMSRFNHTKNSDTTFSAKRLSFFLNRAWMISYGLKLALQRKDNTHWNALTITPKGVALKKLEVVTIGVSKKVVRNAFCVFEFRLRTIGDHSTENKIKIADGTSIIWSAVFPLKKGVNIDAEVFLHLAQKQAFRPIDLIGNKVSTFTDLTLIGDTAPFKIALTDESCVKQNQDFTAWKSLAIWDREVAYQRAEYHHPGPFELDIELQEEVFLDDWLIIEQENRQINNMRTYLIESHDLCFQAQISLDDKVTQKALIKANKLTQKSILFGLMHYESCQLMLQPLALISEKKPTQLMLSNEKKGAADILRNMSF